MCCRISALKSSPRLSRVRSKLRYDWVAVADISWEQLLPGNCQVRRMITSINRGPPKNLVKKLINRSSYLLIMKFANISEVRKYRSFFKNNAFLFRHERCRKEFNRYFVSPHFNCFLIQIDNRYNFLYLLSSKNVDKQLFNVINDYLPRFCKKHVYLFYWEIIRSVHFCLILPRFN